LRLNRCISLIFSSCNLANPEAWFRVAGC
jgi:hypothetical protein